MKELTIAQAEEKHPGGFIRIVEKDDGKGGKRHAICVWSDEAAANDANHDSCAAMYWLKKECVWHNPEIPV